MDIYTKRGLKWINGFLPHDQDIWDKHQENTIISYGFNCRYYYYTGEENLHSRYGDDVSIISFTKFMKLFDTKPSEEFLKLIDGIFLDHIDGYKAYKSYKKLLKLCKKDALTPQ